MILTVSSILSNFTLIKMLQRSKTVRTGCNPTRINHETDTADGSGDTAGQSMQIPSLKSLPHMTPKQARLELSTHPGHFTKAIFTDG